MAAYNALQDVGRESTEQFISRVFTYGMKKSSGPSVNLDDLAPALTYEHEAEHHRIAATTPFGLLIWRLGQALRVNMDFLSRAELRPVFSDFEGSTRRAALAAERWLRDRDGDQPSYGDFVCYECYVLRAYLHALLDGRGMTRAEFAALANVAEHILSVRAGVAHHRRIVVGNPDDELLPLVPDGVPTALEIMEASAVLTEEVLLLSKQVSPSLLEAWRTMSLHGIYAQAHSYFRRRFGFGRLGKLAADLSFCGPIDICATQSTTLPVDLLHPSLLLNRVACHVSCNLLPVDLMDKEYAAVPFDDELFSGEIRAGLSAISQAELWNENFISPRHSELPERLPDAPPHPVEVAIAHAKSLENSYRDAMGSRLQGFGRHSNMMVQETPYQPQIVIYSDGLALPQMVGKRGDVSDGGPNLREQLQGNLLLSEYAASCAVRKVVLDVPPPHFIDCNPIQYAEGDPRRFAAAEYRAYFDGVQRPT